MQVGVDQARHDRPGQRPGGRARAAHGARLLQRLLGGAGLPKAEDTIRVKGDVEGLQLAHQHGTVILCPTHVSNLDSPVVGWALYAQGLPPFTYGAGLNLFTNPIMSFFMRNLGAYRVDRRKTAPLYRDILKEYATVAIENGQDNLGVHRTFSGWLFSDEIGDAVMKNPGVKIGQRTGHSLLSKLYSHHEASPIIEA